MIFGVVIFGVKRHAFKISVSLVLLLAYFYLTSKSDLEILVALFILVFFLLYLVGDVVYIFTVGGSTRSKRHQIQLRNVDATLYDVFIEFIIIFSFNFCYYFNCIIFLH